MPATKIIVIVLAFMGGGLSGLWLHPLLGALFSTALMLILVLQPKGNSDKSTHPIPDIRPSHSLPLQETSQILNEVMLDTQKNLASQIALQDDAIVLLTQSFEAISKRLEAQQTHIKHMRYTGDVAEKDDVQKWGAIAGQLQEGLNDAARALQFEDMAKQNMEYCSAQLHELQPLIGALKTAAQYPEQLDAEVVRYKNSELRHKHNPVSATSVKSGSVDLF